MNYQQGPQGYANVNQGFAQQGYGNGYAVPTGPRPGPALRKWHFGLTLGGMSVMVFAIVFMFIGIAGGAAAGGDEAGMGVLVGILGMYAGMFLSMFMLIGAAIAQAVWIYRIWNWLPMDQRRGAAGWTGYISPGAACGFNFIPYFNIYWLFVLNLGLADAMTRTAGSVNVASPINRDSALWAAVLRMVFWPVGIFLQHSLMKNTDNLAEAIDMARQNGAGYNPAAYPNNLDATGMPPVGGFGG
jgi:hypothetical protein